ncbi:MAG: hypothetical protein OXR66_01605 [Candidatus Woesearchaeota archaeon]|nr:hypothetical protein [Candidatus Woesearchaeota archaeon]
MPAAAFHTAHALRMERLAQAKIATALAVPKKRHALSHSPELVRHNDGVDIVRRHVYARREARRGEYNV